MVMESARERVGILDWRLGPCHDGSTLNPFHSLSDSCCDVHLEFFFSYLFLRSGDREALTSQTAFGTITTDPATFVQSQ